MFEKLPDSLVYTVLMYWLNVRELGRLDSAFAVQSYRSNLLDLMTQIDWRPVFGLDFTTNAAAIYPKILQWLLLRGFRTSQLCFLGGREDNTLSLTSKVIRRDAPAINRVVLHNVMESDDDIIQCLADNCSFLQGLRCHMATVQPSFADLLNRNKHLFELLLRTDGLKDIEDVLRAVHSPSLGRFYYLRDVSTNLANLIVKAFPNVTDLMLEAVDADALQVVASLPVEFMVLHRINNTDGHVSELEWEDQSFSALQELDVRWWCDMAPLASILSHSPQLQDVKFNNENPACNNFGETMLHLLAEHLGPRLRSVELDAVHILPDAGLRLVAQLCPNLEKLVVTYSTNDFTEATVIELLKCCGKLRSLYLYEMKCTPAVVQTAQVHCPEVQLLNLRYQ